MQRPGIPKIPRNTKRSYCTLSTNRGNCNIKKEEQKLDFIYDFTSAFYNFKGLVRWAQDLLRNRSLLSQFKIRFNFIIAEFHFSPALTSRLGLNNEEGRGRQKPAASGAFSAVG